MAMQSEADVMEAARMSRFVAADPANHALRCDAVAAHLTAGDLAQAQQLIQDGLTLWPQDAPLRSLFGQVMLAAQKWAEACALFQSLLAEQPDVHLAYNFAYGCMRLGRFAEAREALLPWARSASVPPPAMAVLLAAMHHSGAQAEALALAAERGTEFAGHPEFLAAYALLAFDEGDLELTRRLSAAEAAGGAHTLAGLVVAGSLALEGGNGDAATSLFEQALRLNPQDGRSWSGLGVASLLRHNLEAAEQQLQQAVALLPQHIGSWHALGWCRIRAGQLGTAHAAFETALALDRNFAESHGGVAVVTALAGRREQAEAACALALRLDPNSFSARYAQLVLAGEAQDVQLMRKGALRMLRHNPSPLALRLRNLLEQS
jgi:tetratricopeptide (TPR) repeat protein